MLRFGKTSGLSGAPFVVSDCVFFQSAHGAKDSRNWPTLPWTGCLPKVFFGTFPGAPFVASPCAFFGFLLCIVASINIKNYVRFTGMSLGFRI